ncbi:DNA repair protein RecO C-terminal domain-containing protein, partial [Patescibacteria group bacterium]|nr:DNA repair protein RecO C-terminal domain-containing protein [Patescibacteria group bacterium]
MFLDGLARENNSLLSQPPKLNYSAIQKRDFVISSLSEKSAVSANSSYTDFSRGAQNDSYRTAWQLDGAIINKYYPSILIFQIQLLNLSGFSPELDKCVVCSKPIKPGENYFSLKLGGVAGKECAFKIPETVLISDNAIKLMRLFQFKGNNKLGNKNSPPDKGACLSGRQGWGVRDKFYLNKCFETIRKLKADKKLV